MVLGQGLGVPPILYLYLGILAQSLCQVRWAW